MKSLLWIGVCLIVTVSAQGFGAGSHLTINSDQALVINGQKVFPIGFTMPPPPDGKTPEGKNGIKELAEAGANFMRTGAAGDGTEFTGLPSSAGAGEVLYESPRTVQAKAGALTDWFARHEVQVYRFKL